MFITQFSTQFSFVALYISFFLALTYFTYICCEYGTISDKNEKYKLKRFILLYLFPIISVLVGIGVIVYLAFISAYTLLITICGGLIYAFGILCFLDDYPYWGILLVSTAIIASTLCYSINFVDVKQDEKIYCVELYNYSNETSDSEESLEELLIILKSQELENTTSDGYGTTEESSEDVESDITLYAFKQYDKKSLENIKDLKNKDFGFIFEIDKYEIIDDTNERIEVTEKNVKKHDIYSYFGFSFTKPHTKSEYTYKVFLNEDSIKLD